MKLEEVFGNDSSFSDLTKAEKEALRQALSIEIKRREEKSRLEQIREIVPISEWLESEYYLGENCRSIYDYWKDLMRDIYDPKRGEIDRINEIIISGSLGVGKSTVSVLILLRKFYELSCYRNVNAMFNLMSTSSIVFLYFSVNKYQANLTGFGDVISFLDSIPYFREHFPRNTRISSLILLPENLMVTYGSGAQHSIGMNLLGSILDEANFFKGKASEEDPRSTKVSELYSSIINRSKSRFVQDGGIDHSISILVSSSTHASSFTEQRISQVAGKKNVIVRSPNLWEVKPKNYSGKKFWVFKGTHSFEPFVVDSVDDINNYRVSEGMGRWVKDENFKGGPDTGRVINRAIKDLPEDRKDHFLQVPIEMKSSFDANIIQSLQDLGGISIAPVGKLFTAVDIYKKSCFDDIEHPFVSDSLVISTGDKIKVNDYLRVGYMFKDRHKPRYLHLDQSAVSDSTGISCVHVSEIIDVEGVKKPVIEVDFMLQINPPKPPKRIAIYKMRDFVSSLKTVYGLKIGRVTYDIWGSEESRQILSEMGINTGYLSVDRNDKAYLDLVSILYDFRLRMYHYEPFRKELFNLIHLRHKGKIDHAIENDDGTPGSKDVADSLVGAIQGVLSSDFTDAYYDGVSDFMLANSGKRLIPDGYTPNESTESLIDKIIEAEIDDIINSM